MSDNTRRVVSGLLCMLATSLAGAQTIQIDGELFRDPTQPPSAVFSMTVVDTMQVVEIEAAQALLSTLTLNFIRAGGLEPVAVINRQPYRIGDNLETAVVSDIRSGEVELTIEGVKHVLTMFSRPVRQSDGQ